MIGKKDKNYDGERILDVDASMQGSLMFKDPVNLRINGRFEGTLNTKGNLMIGERAVVNADITGDSIVVAGKVNGKVNALKELKLIAPAVVTGDIQTPLLSVAEGAVLEGSCKMRAKDAGDLSKNILMTPDELAKYLEVDAAMVLDWVGTGRLPGMREGNAWRFDRSKIDEWVASGKIK